MVRQVPENLDWTPVIEFVRQIYCHDYGKMTWRGGYLTLITGGWSGNEDIISALECKRSLFAWTTKYMWKRGGYHVYRVSKPKKNEARKKVVVDSTTHDSQ